MTERQYVERKKNGDDFPIVFTFLLSETCRPQRLQRMERKWAAVFVILKPYLDLKITLKMKMEIDSYCNTISLNSTLPIIQIFVKSATSTI